MPYTISECPSHAPCVIPCLRQRFTWSGHHRKEITL
jgi:hypothetical protein